MPGISTDAAASNDNSSGILSTAFSDARGYARMQLGDTMTTLSPGRTAAGSQAAPARVTTPAQSTPRSPSSMRPSATSTSRKLMAHVLASISTSCGPSSLSCTGSSTKHSDSSVLDVPTVSLSAGPESHAFCCSRGWRRDCSVSFCATSSTTRPVVSCPWRTAYSRSSLHGDEASKAAWKTLATCFAHAAVSSSFCDSIVRVMSCFPTSSARMVRMNPWTTLYSGNRSSPAPAAATQSSLGVRLMRSWMAANLDAETVARTGSYASAMQTTVSSLVSSSSRMRSRHTTLVRS